MTARSQVDFLISFPPAPLAFGVAADGAGELIRHLILRKESAEEAGDIPIFKTEVVEALPRDAASVEFFDFRNHALS